MIPLRHATLQCAIASALTACVAARAWAQDGVTPFTEGSFTLVVLPDTQNYTVLFGDVRGGGRGGGRGGDTIYDPFEHQVNWIVDHRDEHNILFVLHEGDIVNNNNDTQWTHAKNMLGRLDGVVPYALAPGNHDYGPNGNAGDRSTLFNDYFSASDNPLNDPVQGGALGGVYEPGHLDNAYYTFTSPHGGDFLILALEWGPRDPVVEWANEVVAAHPDHAAILLTHAYMYFDETRYDWQSKGAAQSWNPHSYGSASLPGGTNDGEELWQKLVSKHENFIMTLNGHVLGDGLGYLASEGEHGNTVHQMLFNTQFEAQGGNGWLRLLEFLPDGQTVVVRTYSPYLDQWRTDPANQFTLFIPEPATVCLIAGLGAWALSRRSK